MSHDKALYKSTYTLLYFTTSYLLFRWTFSRLYTCTVYTHRSSVVRHDKRDSRQLVPDLINVTERIGLR